VLIVRGREDHREVPGQALGEREAAHAGHVDVEEHHVGGALGQRGERAVGTQRLPDQLDPAGGGEETGQPGHGERLVIDQEARSRPATGFTPGGRSGSEIDTSLPPAAPWTASRPAAPYSTSSRVRSMSRPWPAGMASRSNLSPPSQTDRCSRPARASTRTRISVGSTRCGGHVLDAVLHQRVQGERGHIAGRERIRQVDRAAQPVPEAGLFDPEIRAHDRNLGADRDGVALARVEREAQQRRELLDEALGAGGVLGDERGDRVQRIEEEVRVQPRLERRQARLGRELLRALALGLQHRAVGDGGIPLGAHRLEDEAPGAHPEAHERRDPQTRREQRAAGRGRHEPDPDDDRRGEHATGGAHREECRREPGPRDGGPAPRQPPRDHRHDHATQRADREADDERDGQLVEERAAAVEEREHDGHHHARRGAHQTRRSHRVMSATILRQPVEPGLDLLRGAPVHDEPEVRHARQRPDRTGGMSGRWWGPYWSAWKDSSRSRSARAVAGEAPTARGRDPRQA
jgi:hypothetical protein